LLQIFSSYELTTLRSQIGGGTGWNIEAMSEYVDVSEFFSSVYLVDFSPSLCEVARKRFKRLGWKNVKVVCQDARTFRLEDYESETPGAVVLRSPSSYYSEDNGSVGGADLITLSYSLSMIVSASHMLCTLF
jgi:betaine lipid synthase